MNKEVINAFVEEFRQKRFKKIRENEFSIKLAKGAKLLLQIIPLRSLATEKRHIIPISAWDEHIMPIGDWDNKDNIDIEFLKKCLFDGRRNNNARPISGYEWDCIENCDGYIIWGKDSETGTTNTYLQIFRSGIIEAVDIKQMNEMIEGENSLGETILNYSELLQLLEIPKPWYIFVSVLNAEDVVVGNQLQCVWSWSDGDDKLTINDLKPFLDQKENTYKTL